MPSHWRLLHDDVARHGQIIDDAPRRDVGHELVANAKPLAAVVAQRKRQRSGKILRIGMRHFSSGSAIPDRGANVGTKQEQIMRL
jgi:hypothetical protein